MKLSFANKGLTIFDASHLDFDDDALPISGARRYAAEKGMLTTLDLSCNRLQAILNASSSLRHLTDLNVSNNLLVSVAALPTTITRLNVSNNKIHSLNGIEALTELRTLDASGNKLVEIETNLFPSALVSLYLSDNQLTSLRSVLHLKFLQTLRVDGNDVRSVDEFVSLGGMRALRNLCVRNNPACNNPRCVSAIIASIPKLTTLEKHSVPQGRNMLINNDASKLQSASTARANLSIDKSQILRDFPKIMKQREFNRSKILAEEHLREENEEALELHRLEVRVNQLEKMLAQEQRTKDELTKKNKQLQHMVKQTADVMETQQRDMDLLQNANLSLSEHCVALRRTVNSMDNAFKAHHATVVQQRVTGIPLMKSENF